MYQITTISTDQRQRIELIVSGTDKAILDLEYSWNLNCWFFSLSYRDFSTNRELLSASPNILRHYQNVLPFGLLVGTKNKLDPMTMDAFTTGTCVMYYLTAADLATLNTELYG